jgi:ElaB/YqjD/DUF883 family membrane-anchored ribosome-binding protein
MSQTANDMRNLRDEAIASGGRLADDARAELAQLRAQVERLMEERVSPVLGAAAETVEGYGRRARETVEAKADALSDSVKERPLLTVAVAAIGGFLLGRLIGGNTFVCPDRQG